MAISTLTPTTPWHARDAKLIFAMASGVAMTTVTSIYNCFMQAAGATGTGSAIQAMAKNVTVTPPETAFDKQDLLGVDSNSFQNAFLDEKPVGTATVTGTLILDRNEILEPYLDTVGTQVTGGYSRYQLGDAKNPVLQVCVHISGASAEVNFGLSGARATKWGDVKLGGPDGHLEQDFTVLCLPKDFYWEYRD